MNNKNREKILIIGGSSGIGLASAQLAVEKGYEVVIASRNHEKLKTAKEKINHENVNTFLVDITKEKSIQSLFEPVKEIDHLVIAGSEVQFGDFRTLSISDAQKSFDSKFFGPYRVIKEALGHINPKGSITLFSGSAGAKPEKGSEIISAINSAVEGFSRALAISLSPIRVNCIAPGLIDTPAYAGLDEDARKTLFLALSENLLIKRAGTATEVAQAVLYLIDNTYTTGTTLYIDGGHAMLMP